MITERMLEKLEETGKIGVMGIDNVVSTMEELEEIGYKCELSRCTDYILVSKKFSRLSLDNGNNYYNPVEILENEKLQEKIKEKWEAISMLMDNDLREKVAYEGNFEIGDDIQFLINYLCKAKCDLIIG